MRWEVSGCTVCFVHPTWMVCEMGGSRPYIVVLMQIFSTIILGYTIYKKFS